MATHAQPENPTPHASGPAVQQVTVGDIIDPAAAAVLIGFPGGFVVAIAVIGSLMMFQQGDSLPAAITFLAIVPVWLLALALSIFATVDR